jgi:hypothetical protein
MCPILTAMILKERVTLNTALVAQKGAQLLGGQENTHETDQNR